jgi:hypothetical protein
MDKDIGKYVAADFSSGVVTDAHGPISLGDVAE